MRPARACFLYYLSVYVNPFKERFLGRHGEALGGRRPKADAKVGTLKRKNKEMRKKCAKKGSIW